MMKESRIILRNAYDGNYEQAIKLLLEVVEKQDEVLQSQVIKIQKLSDKVNILQQSVARLNENLSNDWTNSSWMT